MVKQNRQDDPLMNRRAFLIASALTTGAVLIGRSGFAAERRPCIEQDSPEENPRSLSPPPNSGKQSDRCPVPTEQTLERLLKTFDCVECIDKENSDCVKVLVKGTGRAVVILHELPGLTPHDLALGCRLADEGFTVYMPLLFGKPGQDKAFRSMLHVSLGSNLRLFTEGSNEHTARWLTALCEQAHADCRGPGVGVIGLCLTGHLPLTLLKRAPVVAPVLSEPTVPLPVRFVSTARDKALGITADELADAKKAVQEKKLKILALRFTNDWRCPGERFKQLHSEFNREGQEPVVDAIEIESPNSTHGIKGCAHSVLAAEYSSDPEHPANKAYRHTVTFLRERLPA